MTTWKTIVYCPDSIWGCWKIILVELLLLGVFLWKMSALRQYNKLPVWIVENHNEVIMYISSIFCWLHYSAFWTDQTIFFFLSSVPLSSIDVYPEEMYVVLSVLCLYFIDLESRELRRRRWASESSLELVLCELKESKVMKFVTISNYWK